MNPGVICFFCYSVTPGLEFLCLYSPSYRSRLRKLFCHFLLCNSNAHDGTRAHREWHRPHPGIAHHDLLLHGPPSDSATEGTHIHIIIHEKRGALKDWTSWCIVKKNIALAQLSLNVKKTCYAVKKEKKNRRQSERQL